MSKLLFIRLPSCAEMPIRWLLDDGKRTKTGDLESESLETLAPLSSQCHTVLIVPGEQVTYHHVPLAGRSRLALQAVPYQLEEYISVPVDDVHVAVSSAERGVVDACVVSHSHMQGYIELIRRHQLDVNAISPDYLLLPDTELVGFIEHQRVLVRGENAGCNLSVDSFAVWWGLCNHDSIAIYGELNVSEDGIKQGRVAIDDLLVLMVDQYRSRKTLNLLQGDYGIPNAIQKNLTKLYAMAVLIVLSCLTYTLTLYTDNQQAVRQVGHLKTLVKAEYSQAFPDRQRFVRMRVQMQRELDRLSQRVSQRSLLSELHRINGSLATVGVQATQLEYTQVPFSLMLQLRSKDTIAFERLASVLAQGGIEAQIETVPQKGSDYTARLMIGTTP